MSKFEFETGFFTNKVLAYDICKMMRYTDIYKDKIPSNFSIVIECGVYKREDFNDGNCKYIIKGDTNWIGFVNFWEHNLDNAFHVTIERFKAIILTLEEKIFLEVLVSQIDVAEVLSIEKQSEEKSIGLCERIVIYVKDSNKVRDILGQCEIALPWFIKGSKFKGMEPNFLYSVETLGLFEED